MKIRAFLIFLLGVGLQSYAMTKETQEIFDSISAIEYESSYPFVYKSIDEETGTEIETVVSDGSDFLSRPVDKRFWIYDYKTGKYWKKADIDFDLNFGLYSAVNRSFSHGRAYIIVIYRGLLSIYNYDDNVALSMIDKILTECNSGSRKKIKVIERILERRRNKRKSKALMQKVIGERDENQ